MTATADNVDLFADVAAVLFARLYAAFPVPVDVETDMMADKALPGADPVGATPEAFVEASVLWLANAGFLTFEPGQLGARMIERVGLTARGFLALQSSVRDCERPIGRRLVSDIDPAARRELVGAALSNR